MKNGRGDVFCSINCLHDWQEQKHKAERSIKRGVVERFGETRECCRCHQILSINQFSTRGDRLTVRHECTKCFSQYTSDRYTSRKIALIEFLGGKCKKCGTSCHPSAFHFHHEDPSIKQFAWNQLRKQSTEKVLNEIKKCVLICANCHAVEHSTRQFSSEVLRMKENFLSQLISGSSRS